MEMYEMTCCCCPTGCLLKAGVENGAVKEVKGNMCIRGEFFGKDQMEKYLKNLKEK